MSIQATYVPWKDASRLQYQFGGQFKSGSRAEGTQENLMISQHWMGLHCFPSLSPVCLVVLEAQISKESPSTNQSNEEPIGE